MIYILLIGFYRAVPCSVMVVRIKYLTVSLDSFMHIHDVCNGRGIRNERNFLALSRCLMKNKRPVKKQKTKTTKSYGHAYLGFQTARKEEEK